MKFRYSFLIAVSSILVGFFASCSTVPVTGRSQVSLVSDEEVVKMSDEMFQQMKLQYRVSRNPKYLAMVERVGEQIADVAVFDIGLADWEFVVFEDDSSINAFAMAGGKVGVFTGVFRVVQKDSDLAVILGHEIAHVAARHVNERLSKDKLIQGGGLAVLIATSGTSTGYGTQNALSSIYGLGTQIGVTLPFNRAMEREADMIGLMYMARAGYNPEDALGFWERLDQESVMPAPPQWLSTHPSHESRIEQLHAAMPEAVSEYEYTKDMDYLNTLN